MDIEEVYVILKGASPGKCWGGGASLDVVLKWFKKSNIIDNEYINQETFVHSYQRLEPNGDDLRLTQMIVLFAILSREVHKPIEYLISKFETVKDEIIEEIQAHWKKVEEERKKRKNRFNENEEKPFTKHFNTEYTTIQDVLKDIHDRTYYLRY